MLFGRVFKFALNSESYICDVPVQMVQFSR